MLKTNRIVIGVTILSLITFPRTNTVVAFANGEVSNNIQLKELNINKYGSIKNIGYENIQNDIEKYNEQKREEETRKIEEQKKNIEKDSYDLEITFSYYTDLADENGGHVGITCTGKRLIYGYVASNVWDLGTQFETETGEIFIVADRGGNHFNSYNRVDCFIPREQGESDNQYKKRVLNMGRKLIKCRIIK